MREAREALGAREAEDKKSERQGPAAERRQSSMSPRPAAAAAAASPSKSSTNSDAITPTVSDGSGCCAFSSKERDCGGTDGSINAPAAPAVPSR